MLHLYYKNDPLPDLPVIRDCQAAYDMITLDHTNEKMKLLFKLIEQGDLVDDFFYIDRFGYKLDRDQCSMGLKTAITVLMNPDKLVSGHECGVNAVDAIAAVCHEGYLIIISAVDDVKYLGYDVDFELQGERYIGDMKEEDEW